MTTNTNHPDLDSSTPDYASRFQGEVGKWLLNAQKKGTLELLNTSNQLKILDIGGAHGQNIDILLKNKHHITVFGSTGSPTEMIQSALDSSQINFKTGNLIELPFQDQSFDVVIAYRLMTHLKSWKEFIKEITRVSRKTVLIDFPPVKSFNIISKLLFTVKKKIEKNTRQFHILNEPEIIKLFQDEQFSPVQKYGQFFFPMALHRMLKNRQLSETLEAFSRSLKLNHHFGSPLLYRFDRENNSI